MMTEEEKESPLVYGVPRAILDSFRKFAIQRQKRVRINKFITNMEERQPVPGPSNQPPPPQRQEGIEEIELLLDPLEINGRIIILEKPRQSFLLIMSTNTPTGDTMISFLAARKDPTTMETERWDRKKPIGSPILIRAGWSTTTRRGPFGLRISIHDGIFNYDVNMEFSNDEDRDRIHAALSLIENNRSPTPPTPPTPDEGSSSSDPEGDAAGGSGPVNKRAKTD